MGGGFGGGLEAEARLFSLYTLSHSCRCLNQQTL